MAEENETENEVNPMAALVQHALDQDYNNANKVFGDIMGTRINDVLDQEKIKLSNQVYNGIEPEEENDEQLELDLADEEEDHDEDTENGEEDLEVEDEDLEDTDEVEEDEEEEEELDAHDG